MTAKKEHDTKRPIIKTGCSVHTPAKPPVNPLKPCAAPHACQTTSQTQGVHHGDLSQLRPCDGSGLNGPSEAPHGSFMKLQSYLVASLLRDPRFYQKDRENCMVLRSLATRRCWPKHDSNMTYVRTETGAGAPVFPVQRNDRN